MQQDSPGGIGEGALLDGRYRLGGLIGRGGIASVYEGHDLRLERPVAVKLLLDGSSPTMAERLFREARSAARSEHPAVVTMFGYGTDDDHGLNYLVMERLRGQDLRARLADIGRCPLDFVRQLGVDLADALSAVHAHGTVHRDLKPANLFLARRGTLGEGLKILDFGVAKQADTHSLTTSREVLGTLAYMAPEQFRDATDVDARADIYSMGVVLYECLAGKRPFMETSLVALSEAVLLRPPAALTSLRPETPKPLVALVESCLQKRRDERPRSMALIRDALLAV